MLAPFVCRYTSHVRWLKYNWGYPSFPTNITLPHATKFTQPLVAKHKNDMLPLMSRYKWWTVSQKSRLRLERYSTTTINPVCIPRFDLVPCWTYPNLLHKLGFHSARVKQTSSTNAGSRPPTAAAGPWRAPAPAPASTCCSRCIYYRQRSRRARLWSAVAKKRQKQVRPGCSLGGTLDQARTSAAVATEHETALFMFDCAAARHGYILFMHSQCICRSYSTAHFMSSTGIMLCVVINSFSTLNMMIIKQCIILLLLLM